MNHFNKHIAGKNLPHSISHLLLLFYLITKKYIRLHLLDVRQNGARICNALHYRGHGTP
jgi:hypothetical protein